MNFLLGAGALWSGADILTELSTHSNRVSMPLGDLHSKGCQANFGGVMGLVIVVGR